MSFELLPRTCRRFNDNRRAGKEYLLDVEQKRRRVKRFIDASRRKGMLTRLTRWKQYASFKRKARTVARVFLSTVYSRHVLAFLLPFELWLSEVTKHFSVKCFWLVPSSSYQVKHIAGLQARRILCGMFERSVSGKLPRRQPFDKRHTLYIS